MGCVLDVSTGLVGYVRAGVLGFPSTGQIRDGISHSVLSLPQRQGSKGFQQGLQSAQVGSLHPGLWEILPHVCYSQNVKEIWQRISCSQSDLWLATRALLMSGKLFFS